jgi:dTDP-4-amino-4,6-dideoxygalactose transaminase
MNVKPLTLFDIQGAWGGLSQKASDRLKSILESGRFVLGPYTKELEEAFAQKGGFGHTCSVSSGTSGLYLALRALDIGLGDEVITTPMSFIATIHAILLTGARPILADIDPGHFGLSPKTIAPRITERTRAVILVHLFGNPAPAQEIVEFLAPKGIALIEDTCQAFGAKRNGKYIGSVGTFGVFSFYPTKNLGGAGDSGMVVTEDNILFGRIQSLKLHGETAERTFGALGINARMDEIQAALLLLRLEAFDEEAKRRKALGELYRQELQGFVGLQEPIEGAEPLWHLFSVCLQNREHIREALAKEGIQTGVYYPLPFHMVPHLRPYFPNLRLHEAEALADSILQIPLHPGMKLEDALRVIRVLKAALPS